MLRRCSFLWTYSAFPYFSMPASQVLILLEAMSLHSINVYNLYICMKPRFDLDIVSKINFKNRCVGSFTKLCGSLLVNYKKANGFAFPKSIKMNQTYSDAF